MRDAIAAYSASPETRHELALASRKLYFAYMTHVGAQYDGLAARIAQARSVQPGPEPATLRPPASPSPVRPLAAAS